MIFDILTTTQQQKIDELRKNLQTSDAFRIWLQKMPANQIIGIRRTCDRCPISNYLKEQGINCPIVKQQRIEYTPSRNLMGLMNILLECNDDADSSITQMPRWIQDFIATIDYNTDLDRENITAAIALESLLLTNGDIELDANNI